MSPSLKGGARYDGTCMKPRGSRRGYNEIFLPELRIYETKVRRERRGGEPKCHLMPNLCPSRVRRQRGVLAKGVRAGCDIASRRISAELLVAGNNQMNWVRSSQASAGSHSHLHWTNPLRNLLPVQDYLFSYVHGTTITNPRGPYSIAEAMHHLVHTTFILVQIYRFVNYLWLKKQYQGSSVGLASSPILTTAMLISLGIQQHNAFDRWPSHYQSFR